MAAILLTKIWFSNGAEKYNIMGIWQDDSEHAICVLYRICGSLILHLKGVELARKNLNAKFGVIIIFNCSKEGCKNHYDD